MIYRRMLSSAALVVGAFLFSIGLQAFAAFTPPTAAPPNADAYAPLNTGPATQTKTGQLNVNKVQIANKWLLGDTGNDDWLRIFNTANNNYYGGVAANNLWAGINLYVNGVIVGNGARESSFGSVTMYGSKNGWAGINFINSGTLMMSPSYSGFFNAADNNWRWYVDDNGNSIQPGSATIQNGLKVSNAGGAYTYITLLDDESPNGVKYIHANSNAIGFLNGYGGWMANWDNAGNSWQQGGATVGGGYNDGCKYS